ncbi:hypothetical protein BDW71DRAFT_209457 [Aspergillus fruticulosus]
MFDSESEVGSALAQPSTATTKEPLYNYDQRIAALEGRSIPDDLSSAAARCAVIRGLRCFYDFVVSPAMTDLCTMSRFSEILYCLWNLDFVNKDTYRQTAHRYPSMHYQVCRAYAAAGYINVYQELDLFPDISIA